ncbi:hypothetical protein IAT40_003664 [Kwoniella sp. CBS 6097]
MLSQHVILLVLPLLPVLYAQQPGRHRDVEARNIASYASVASYQPSSNPYAAQSPSNTIAGNDAPTSSGSGKNQVPPVGAFTYNGTATFAPLSPLSITSSAAVAAGTSSSLSGGIYSSSIQAPSSSLTESLNALEKSTGNPSLNSNAVVTAHLSSSTVNDFGAYEASATKSSEYVNSTASSSVLPSSADNPLSAISVLSSEVADQPTSTSTRTHLTTATKTIRSSGIVAAQETSAVYNGDAAGTLSDSGVGDSPNSSVFTVVGNSTLYQVVKGHPTGSAAASGVGAAGGVVGAQDTDNKQWAQQGQWLRAACASGAATPK